MTPDARVLATAIAARMALVEREPVADEFRRALLAVPPAQRDAWLDGVLGIDGVPEDGPELPRGCVPYLPCPVDVLLRMIEHAEIRSNDVFVDVGSGLGRATMLTHLLTGAGAIGLEIQPDLVQACRRLSRRLNLSRCPVVPGDAARLTAFIPIGTVFFLYCPFSGERLAKVLDHLEDIARAKPIRVCTVALELPARSWLTRLPVTLDDLAVYRSTLLD